MLSNLDVPNGNGKLDYISEIDGQQEHSFDDLKRDTLRLEEPEKNGKDDFKSIKRDEENSVILNNSTYMNRKISNARIMPDMKLMKRLSSKNNYNLYPITLAKSYMSKDADHPFIYSVSEFQPISFLQGQEKFGFNVKKKILEYPSSTFIEFKDFISLITPLSKDIIFQGTRKDDKIGLVLTDKSVSSKFKGIVGDIMASIFTSLSSQYPLIRF